MLPWWGWLLIAIGVIIFIVIICYIFREHILACEAICVICDGIGEGISEIDISGDN